MAAKNPTVAEQVINNAAVITDEMAIEKISTIAKAERVTKKVLGELSRELLTKWENDFNPAFINALLGMGDDGKFILTPVNWRVACMYFHAFIGATSNYDKEVKEYVTKGKGARTPLVFGIKSKNAQKRTGDKRAAWLEDENNSIWNWADTNVKMEDTPVDYSKKVIKVVTDAMAEEKGNLSVAQVIDALLQVEGLDMAAIMQAVHDANPANEQAAA